MSRVVVTVTLQLVIDPKLDSDSDIKDRIECVLEDRLQNGHLEGCEHGAQITNSSLTIQVTRMKDEPLKHNHFGEVFMPDTCPACKALQG
jgi:hypothetical protein